MRKLILGLCVGLTLLVPSWAFAGHCGYRQNVRNYSQRSYNYHQNYDYENVVELIVVQPQVQYIVEPEVYTEKIERVVEVKEVERVRVVQKQKIANLIQQIFVPILIKEKVHY